MPGASPGYQVQTPEHVLKIRDMIPEDTKGVKILIGMESEYYGMHDQLGISAEGARAFDFVNVPFSHTHMRGKVIPFEQAYLDGIAEIERRMRNTFPEVSDRQIEKWMSLNRHADILAVLGYQPKPDLEHAKTWLVKNFLGLMNNAEFIKLCQTVPTFVAHPFSAGGYTGAEVRQIISEISDETFVRMFTLMAQRGAGYDARVNNFDTDHPDTCQFVRIARIARDCGVLFSFSTDAHSLSAFSKVTKSADVYDAIGLCKENLHPLIRNFVK